MKLVPFVLTQKDATSSDGLKKYRWLVFLSFAGRGVWKTEESGLLSENQIQEEYLLPNGIQSLKIRMDEQTQTAWIQVDPTKTNLADFYSWDEALAKSEKPECWRPFYFFQDNRDAFWWSGKGIECDAEIQGLGNVADCFSDVLRHFA